MKLSVIISTYNAPERLEKVLAGYCLQTFKDFEIIIADDGSDKQTEKLINSFSGFLNIKHVWQDDDGFRKCKILNKAILVAEANYLVFSDGDCIPRKDFLQVHFDKRKKGHFLSGGYFKLPFTISNALSLNDVHAQYCFDLNKLKLRGLPKSFKNNKLSPSHFKTAWLNRLTTTKSTWNGHNSSGWKEDILSVNGFNENMGYGGEDRELGERLMNKGIKGIQIRYSAICVHLEHDRAYISEDVLQNNLLIRRATKKQRLTWTNAGIVKKSLPKIMQPFKPIFMKPKLISGTFANSGKI